MCDAPAGRVGLWLRVGGVGAGVAAPPGTRLVIEEATGRVLVDGVPMRLAERHVKLLTVLAKADGPVAAKEVDDVVGARSGEGAARAAKATLARAMEASFRSAGRTPPRDLDAFVVREGRLGYRLGVAVVVVRAGE